MQIAPLFESMGVLCTNDNPMRRSIAHVRPSTIAIYLQLYFWVNKKIGSQYVYTLKECKMQNGYPSNARHKMFDLTRKAIIFNLALRPAQIVSCKKYQFGNYSFAEPWCPVKAAAAAAGQWPSGGSLPSSRATAECFTKSPSAKVSVGAHQVTRVFSLSYKGPWRDDIIVQKRGFFPW